MARKESEDDSKGEEIWVTKFDEEHAQKFREAVMSNTKLDQHKPIVIYIDSYGGYVDSLAKMIETVDEVPNPIVTVCMGKAMSCGAVLLSHGDLRFCGKHSRIMVHEVSGGSFGDVHDMYADAEETKRLNEHFLGLMAKNCGFNSYSEFRKWMKQQDGRDRYMNAEDAKRFGIIDAVGVPRINSSTLYEIQLLQDQKKVKPGEIAKNPKLKKSDSKKT
jgi:ATP-dependent Clp protease, protease subunit